MLVITVELYPLGDAKKRKHLGTAAIWNDATGSHGSGAYKATISKRGKPNEIWKKCSVEGFPRLKLGAWDLLYRCLRAMIGSRNPIGRGTEKEIFSEGTKAFAQMAVDGTGPFDAAMPIAERVAMAISGARQAAVDDLMRAPETEIQAPDQAEAVAE